MADARPLKLLPTVGGRGELREFDDDDSLAANLVKLSGAADHFPGATVEGALQEVGEMIGDIAAALDTINGEVIP